MSKEYFKNFKWIKKVDNAKSLSFISNDRNGILSHNLYLEIIDILKDKENRFRVSLHHNNDDDLHNMIIGMKKGSYVYPHKHHKSESYHIIEGKIVLIYFNNDGSILKTSILNKDFDLVARVNKNTYHALISLEDTIYHETRIGPFISEGDSIFANWYLPNTKDEYMKQLEKTILGKQYEY